MKANFDTFAFCNSRFNSQETNLLTRLKSFFSRAVDKRIKLPRFVVVVLDNDLIQYLAFIKKGVETLLGEWFEWVMVCFTELCKARCTQLPKKAVRDDYPQLYFVAPPKHKRFGDNNAQQTLLNCMETTVKIYDNVPLIKMIELWNFNDEELVDDDGHITSLGLTTYWVSIDAAVAFNVKKRDEYLSR